MKNIFAGLLVISSICFAAGNAGAQQAAIKIGVFDIEAMVTAMPQYAYVDSMLQIYQIDSLNAELEVYQSEYKRLDSTWKKDSADGTKSKAIMDYTSQKRQEMAINLVYWQQISQQKIDNKKRELSQSLYEQVGAAYQKVIQARKYYLILKPGAYELGSNVDNLFITVARELKLTDLPREFFQFGPDPDAKQQQQKPPATPPAKKPN